MRHARELGKEVLEDLADQFDTWSAAHSRVRQFVERVVPSYLRDRAAVLKSVEDYVYANAEQYWTDIYVDVGRYARRRGSQLYRPRRRPLFLAKRRYEGPPLEEGKTSIKGAAAPAIQWLAKQGAFQPGMRVLDWGAGRMARNGDFLRGLGCEVYAYDPFHSTGGTGWEPGSVVSTKPPAQEFDAGFTCFVLNVVPENVEDEIIRDMSAYTTTLYHVVRNRDVYDMAYKALTGQIHNQFIVDFFVNQFADDEELEAWENDTIYEDTIEAFCQFGFESGKGRFQRIPSDLEEKGYRIVRETSGFTIYANA